MQTIVPSSEPGRIVYEELAQVLRSMMEQITALQELARANEEGGPDIQQVRQGLDRLAEMAGELLALLETAGGVLPLAALPGISLTESLSQLVESTAETLGLSSRVTFAGRERELPDYLARLLYRVAQEILARVSSHAGARRLRFTLDYRNAEVVMSIEDDGVPAEQEQPPANEEAGAPLPFLHPGQGGEGASDRLMRRLRAQVEGLGGAFEINSGVEQGVQVRVCVPERGEPLPASARETEGSARIKVLVVDGQAVSRAGLRRLLESYPDLEIVGEAGDSMQAVSETAELLPQIVLIDAQLPENGALETLRQLRQLNAETRALLLAGQEDEALLYEAMRAGAGGYVSKEVAPDELAQAVRAVARGEVLLQPQLAARLLTRFGGQEQRSGYPQESLTAREREVLQLLARGLRNKEIAARLVVSERTVNFHLANIYAKLHVSGRTEALSKALEQGLLKV
jgi:DNA-binding NarL/FixJ family response regulator